MFGKPSFADKEKWIWIEEEKERGTKNTLWADYVYELCIHHWHIQRWAVSYYSDSNLPISLWARVHNFHMFLNRENGTLSKIPMSDSL